jgi:peptidyl-prolyl cis-trans isomerase SurA
VWTKAIKDTVGLEKYYEQTKNNYLWDTRLDASVLTVKDPSILKSLQKMLKKGASDEQLLARFNHDSIQKISIDHRKFVKDENPLLKNTEWKPGISKVTPLADTANMIIVVHKVVASEPKLLNEIRGTITAEYQNYLEKAWIAELRSKYPVFVDREIFNTIKTH